MPKRYKLHLSDAERTELDHLVRTGSPAYVRERASVLLKLESGCGLRATGRNSGLTRHKAGTIKEWAVRYKEKGKQGLLVLPGRGRKALISPPQPGASAGRN
jgi:hypothetical protein